MSGLCHLKVMVVAGVLLSGPEARVVAALSRSPLLGSAQAPEAFIWACTFAELSFDSIDEA